MIQGGTGGTSLADQFGIFILNSVGRCIAVQLDTVQGLIEIRVLMASIFAYKQFSAWIGRIWIT